MKYSLFSWFGDFEKWKLGIIKLKINEYLEKLFLASTYTFAGSSTPDNHHFLLGRKGYFF